MLSWEVADMQRDQFGQFPASLRRLPPRDRGLGEGRQLHSHRLWRTQRYVPLPASSANGVCQVTKYIKVWTSKAPDRKIVTTKDTMQTNNLTL